MTKETLLTTNKVMKKSIKITKNLDKQIVKTTKHINKLAKPLSKGSKLSKPFSDMKKQVDLLNKSIASNDLVGFQQALLNLNSAFSGVTAQSLKMLRSMNQANQSYQLLSKVFQGDLTVDTTSLLLLDSQTRQLIHSFTSIKTILNDLKSALVFDSSSLANLDSLGNQLVSEFSVMNQSINAFNSSFVSSQAVVGSFGSVFNTTLSLLDSNVKKMVDVSQQLGAALTASMKTPIPEVRSTKNSFDQLKDSLSNLFSPLQQTASVGAVFDEIKGKIGALDGALGSVGFPDFQTSVLGIGNAFQKVTSQSSSMFQKMSQSMDKSMNETGENYSLLKNVLKGKLELDNEAFKKLEDNQKKTVEKFLNMKDGVSSFGETLSSMGNKASESFTKIYNSTGVLGKSLQGINQIGGLISDSLGNQMDQMKAKMSEKFSSMANSMKETFSNITGPIKDTFSSIAGKATESFSTIYNSSGKVATGFRGIVQSGTDFSQKMQYQLSLLGMDIRSKVPELAGMGDAFSQSVLRVKTGFSGMFNEGSKFRQLLGSFGEKSFSFLGEGLEKSAGMGMKSLNMMVQGLNSVFGFALKALGPAAILGVALAGFALLDGQMDGQISNMIQTAITKGPEIIQNFVQGIISKLPDLIASGTQLVAGLAEAISVNLPVIIQSGMDLLQELINGVIQNLPSLIDSALLIIETLTTSLLNAAPQLLLMGLNLLSSLVDGLFQDPNKLIDTVTRIIETLTTQLQTNLPLIIAKGIEILVKLAEGIASVLPKLIPVAMKAITVLVGTLLEQVPQLIDAAIKIVATLAKGIWDSLPEILKAAWELIKTLVGGILGLLPDLATAAWRMANAIIKEISGVDLFKTGGDIIRGLVDGMIDLIGDTIEAVKGIGKKIGDTFKSIFRIHSPSRWMRDEIGAMLPAGLAIGIERNAHIVDQPMDDLASKIILPSLDSVDQQVDSVQKFSTQSSSSNTQTLRVEKQPATFNIQLGNQQFKAFVADISEAMGQESAINLVF